MPGRQHKYRGFGPWSDPDILPPLPKKKNRKTKAKKRYHHSFRVLIALGLIPTKSRQCDPFGLRLNTMHVMEGDCEKSSECLTAEGAPEVAKPDVEGTTESKADIVEKVDNGIVNGENEHEDIEMEKVDNTEEKIDESNEDELNVKELEAELDAKDEEEKQVEEEKAAENLVLSVKEEKEELQVTQEDDDRNSVSSSHVSQSEIDKRKRSIEREGEISSGSESDNGRKKLKTEQVLENRADNHLIEDDRERAIRDYLQSALNNTDDIDRNVDKLQKEVDSLADLARAKETEWNAILRIKKLKEEMLERLLRRRRIISLDEQPKIDPNLHNNKSPGNNHLMMVPIVSSSPVGVHRGNPQSKMSDYTRMQRPILPKPYGNIMDQTSIVREGRNGPVLDVKSIIADYSSPYRARHPENVPRRGRRMRTDNRTQPSPYLPHPSSLISMANMALGSGSRVRTSESAYNLSQDRPVERGPLEGLKDIAANFSKMKGPPPPYPEVTLHPVTRPPTPPSSSLLHGILTKNNPNQSRPSSFSPTLARLLTAPERPSNPAPPPHYRPQHNPLSSINDILSSSQPKSRNEITITPVSGNPTKPKEDVVILQDDEDADGDRLVIDESAEGDDVPQCQGCRQKSSQFVCAGCGNQWYCSRECQVTAWEEHSEICSG